LREGGVDAAHRAAVAARFDGAALGDLAIALYRSLLDPGGPPVAEPARAVASRA